MTSDLHCEAVLAILARQPTDFVASSGAISEQCAKLYRHETRTANLYELSLEPWTFLFDFSSEVDAEQWNHTIAAWGLSEPQKRPRDETYQRNYPSLNGRASRPLDKGHMVPHQSGGDMGQDIFPQDRELNRGWSDEGKRYRALEREIGRTPSSLFVHRQIHIDATDFLGWIELAILRGADVSIEGFQNRFD